MKLELIMELTPADKAGPGNGFAAEAGLEVGADVGVAAGAVL
jgi:hypothetical protein